MSTVTATAVLDQVFEPVSRCLTPDVAKRIAGLRASPKMQRRLDELAAKSSAGKLSSEERDEYECWVRAINSLSVLQAKARKVVASAGA
jgi:hypothetical protein